MGVLACLAIAIPSKGARRIPSERFRGMANGARLRAQKTPSPDLYALGHEEHHRELSILGLKGMPLKVATLDPSKWTVHLEADTKDATPSPHHHRRQTG